MVLSQEQKEDIASLSKAVVKECLLDVDFMQKLTDKLSKLIMAKMEDKLKQVSSKCDILAATVTKLEKENEELRKDMDGLEQYSRRNNLRIFGIKEDSGENVQEKVLNVISNQLGLPITIMHIDRCHRVGKQQQGMKPRGIIIKFISYQQRSLVFAAKKKLKGSGIQIREDLTRKRVNLLNIASQRFNFKNTWTFDGIIYVNQNNHKHRIECLGDLDKLNKI